MVWNRHSRDGPGCDGKRAHLRTGETAGFTRSGITRITRAAKLTWATAIAHAIGRPYPVTASG